MWRGKSETDGQALYKIGEALYFKNIPVIRSQVKFIKDPSCQCYYQAIIFLEDGNIDGANELIEKLLLKWMKNTLFRK